SALLGLLPPEKRPKGVALRGAVTGSLHASGNVDSARASLDLGVADARLADGEHEGHPVPLHLTTQLAYARTTRGLSIPDAPLTAGDLVLRGDADVRGLGAAPSLESLSLTLSGPAERLIELLPKEKRPPGLSISGPLAGKLSLHGSPPELAGVASLDL